MEKSSTVKNLVQLFFSFVKIGMFTIGGGMAMIPVIERVVVYEKNWLTEEEMLDCIALSQVIPGVIGVSCANFIGRKLYGLKGSIVASLGIILPSYLIIIGVVCLLGEVEGNRYAEGAMTGIKAAVTGSIIVTAFRMAKRTLKDPFSWIMALVGFVLIAAFRVNAVWVVLTGMAAGLVMTFVFRRGGDDK